MCVVVYIDILLFVNLVVNGLLIFVTAKTVGAKISFLRISIADIVASGYGLIVCLPAFAFSLNIFIKSFAAAAVVGIAFKTDTVRAFFKYVSMFLFFTFSYTAVILLLQTVPFVSDYLFIRNNEIYYNVPVRYLLLSGIILLFVQRFIMKLMQKSIPKELFYDCTVKIIGQERKLRCFLDTGNMTSDFLSGLPVVIADKESLAIDYDSEELKTKFRIITYKSADGKKGILQAFRADSITIMGRERQAIVAVSETPLSSTGEYSAIIGTTLIQEGTQ